MMTRRDFIRCLAALAIVPGSPKLLALEPKPVGPFPVLLDYARYNERWGVLAVRLL